MPRSARERLGEPDDLLAGRLLFLDRQAEHIPEQAMTLRRDTYDRNDPYLAAVLEALGRADEAARARAGQMLPGVAPP